MSRHVLPTALLRIKTHTYHLSTHFPKTHTLTLSSLWEDQQGAAFPTKICSDKSHSYAILQTAHQNVLFRLCGRHFYCCYSLIDWPNTKLEQVFVCLVSLCKVVVLKLKWIGIALAHQTQTVKSMLKQHSRAVLNTIFGAWKLKWELSEYSKLQLSWQFFLFCYPSNLRNSLINSRNKRYFAYIGHMFPPHFSHFCGETKCPPQYYEGEWDFVCDLGELTISSH